MKTPTTTPAPKKATPKKAASKKATPKKAPPAPPTPPAPPIPAPKKAQPAPPTSRPFPWVWVGMALLAVALLAVAIWTSGKASQADLETKASVEGLNTLRSETAEELAGLIGRVTIVEADQASLAFELKKLDAKKADASAFTTFRGEVKADQASLASELKKLDAKKASRVALRRQRKQISVELEQTDHLLGNALTASRENRKVLQDVDKGLTLRQALIANIDEEPQAVIERTTTCTDPTGGTTVEVVIIGADGDVEVEVD